MSLISNVDIASRDLARGFEPVLLMQDAGMRPDPWQEQVLRSDARRMMLCCSRQSGKSTTCSAIALHRAIYWPRSLVLLLSPSERQSKELHRKVVDHWKALDGAPRAISESTLQLELENRSRICALPGSEQTIRGYSAPDLILLDEAAHTLDSLISAVLPMQATNSYGRIIVLSSPNGRTGWFCEAWMNDGTWEKTLVTYRGCPRISEENVMFFRRTMGELMFRQEFLCEFLDLAAQVFPLEVIEKAFNSELMAWRI